MRKAKWMLAASVAALVASVLAYTPGASGNSPEPLVAGTFTDVEEGRYYSDAVNWAQVVDVTTGTSPTTFSPDRQLVRKEGITFIHREAGAPIGAPDSGFTDVPDGSYYEEAVNWAKAEGITTGISSTLYGSDDLMTRAMYITMIWRSAGSPTGSPDSGFSDVVAGSYYEEAVNWAKAEGITTGISSTLYGPNDPLTRAMAVTFLWRQAGSSTFQLNIFHINDHHSNLEADDIDLIVGEEEAELELGGFPRVVSAIDFLETANAGENNATVHAGDAITGTLFYTLFAGEADAALMNEVCFDMFAVGNHEFDAGDEGLKTFLDFLNATPFCDTPVLAANVRPAIGTPLAPAAAVDDYLQPYTIEQYGDESVAFVGINIAQKTQVSSQPLDTTVFLDEIETAQKVIDDLTLRGYDKIGLVTHIGYDTDLDLVSMVDGVDFVVGGDSHTFLGDIPALGLEGEGDYPTVTTNKGGDTTCVVQAWQYSTIVGHLGVEFDADGDVTGCRGTPHPLLGDVTDDDADGDGTSVTQAQVDAALAAAGLMTFAPDADAQAVLEKFNDEVKVLEQEVIGTASDDLCLARFPYQDESPGDDVNAGRSTLCAPADLPNGGEIQQAVTDGFLARAFRGEIALQNSGGVRVDIPAGEITIADAYELLPFANTLYELEMTGAEILSALEQGLDYALDPTGSSGAYPYGSGIRWDVDWSAAGTVSDPRFTNVEVQPKGTVGWVPIDPTATYVVVANSFMSTGGDGYEVLADVVADGRGVDTYLDYAQSFIDWIVEDLGGTLAPPTDFSTQSYTPVPAGI